MPKRKSVAVDEGEVTPRRSTRHKTSSSATAASEPPAKVTARAKAKPDRRRKAAPPDQSGQSTEPVIDDKKPGVDVTRPKKKPKETPRPEKPAKSSGSAAGSTNGSALEGGKQFWLMKAEPESRFENGVDVRFSIDDLAAKTEPEPWDGIRAYAARNNLRAMKKGDLAFFYHSNTKEPGIVGTMEIVQEHSPDLSAHDPKAPYYDPNSKPSDPKWSVVHVEFRSKFPTPITLKQLREMGGPGGPLENMQMLKQSRLSVSKVSPEEWRHLMGVADKMA
ncbi:Thymocyte nuclear protein 1 [Pleurostoma richardsiae]|uniref:Thymocyte nuclear protein 1 n=1 Tax=Pleurostoma richardsiae TaxID=41990 RepID=A0AA38VIP9_9PEZI|nr:Thymocyte nuclear protein 1 [Pleurostoma richardsiae]